MPVLHWSPRSPYVRKVMIVLHEKGLVENVTTVRTYVDPMVPLTEFMDINPLSKVPTLELDDGQVLFDSHVICRWADRKGIIGPSLYHRDLIAERDEAVGSGLLDVAVPWLIEARLRPVELRSDAIMAMYRSKVNRVLDWLEQRIMRFVERPFDIGHVSIGVALCYLDFRFGVEDWRANRPGLAAWHSDFCQRPSVLATPFIDDSRPVQPS